MNRKLLLPTSLLIVSTLPVACTSGSKNHQKTDIPPSTVVEATMKTYVYHCDNDYKFVARIEGEKVWLFLPEQTIRLPHTPSASGAKFHDKSSTFWSKGQEAYLKVNNKIYQGCKNNRSKAIWEHAKLNGVDFRAVGNEPGWHLEIMNQNRIVLTTDYGQSHYIFKAPDPVINKPASSARYTMQNELHKLTVIIKLEQCHDTMSGQSFDSAVKVILDGVQFNGCGKSLH